METPAITVKTLLGRKNLQFSIDCLKSFIEKSADPIFLQIFEDGTLEQDDVTNLESQLDNSVVILKRKRDIKLESVLKNYPLCRSFREKLPHAQKLFDVMLYDEDDLVFIDSDIFFLKNFKLPKFNQTPAFLADTEHAYSFKPLEFLNIDFPIYPRINSGLFYFPRNMFKIEFAETLLQNAIIQRGLGRRSSWLEQTIWAFFAAQANTVNYFDERQIIIAEHDLKITKHTVAVHLVSTYRHHFAALNDKLTLDDNLTGYTEIKLRKEERFLNKFEFACQKLIKRAKRELAMK